MAAAFAAQGYISLLGLILVPYYLSLVGAAAFGLIGFFMLLQNLLPVLDLGFTQALAREMSRFRAGLLSDREVWSRLRSIEWLLGAIITSAASITIFFSGWIATEWLQSSAISMEIVVSSVVAMAIAIGLRWFAGIYRAALIGMDRQALVNVGGVALATLRFVGVVPVLVHCSASPLAFFYYQVGAAACELLAYLLAVYRSLPPLPERAQPNIAVMRGLRPMASSMGLLALISMLTTQVDKLILSRTLPLEQFGHFVLVSVVAGAATILLGPINQTLQPRLTILAEQHDIAGLRDLYLTASQFVSSVYCAIGVTFAVFAHPLLRAWTGDDSIADFAAPILTWYGPAASLSGILLLPFMLQFAFGQLRLHIIGNVAQLLIMVPAISFGALSAGGVGAGAALLACRATYLLLWVNVVHRRFLPDIAGSWLLKNVLWVASMVSLVVVIARCTTPVADDRILMMIMVACICLAGAVVGLVTGHRTRGALRAALEKFA